MTTNEASRAEFEKWADERGMWLLPSCNGVGKYCGRKTQSAWEAWQAALASHPKVETVLDAPALIGNGHFGKGIPWATVIACAQRHYQHKDDPKPTPELIKAFREGLGGTKDYSEALASRPATIDPIHGDKREVIINALCASANWMRGYAEAFVDDFVGGKAEYVAVADIAALDRWDTFAECGHNGSGFVEKIISPDGEFIRYEDIRKLINQAGEK